MGLSQAVPSGGGREPARADFVLITALEEERDAVLARLPEVRRTNPSSADILNYYISDLPVTFPEGNSGTYHVVLICLRGMGRLQASIATAAAIREWHPRYVTLVGIAGGIAAKGVKLGDVLVSDEVVDYELQKLTAGGDEIRWNVYQANARLVATARDFTSNNWQKLAETKRPAGGTPQRHIGPVASGDKVIALGKALAQYQQRFPTLLGVEMEAAGVAGACFQAANPPGFFMVRGVSDLADEEKDAQSGVWRSYACDVAASYAVELLKSGAVPEQADEALEPITEDLSNGRDGSPGTRSAAPVARLRSAFTSALSAMYEKIDVLEDYKTVHDDLDELEYSLKRVFRLLDGFPDHIGDPDLLEDSLSDFERSLQKLESHAAELVSADTSWIVELRSADEKLRQALSGTDAGQIRKFKKLVRLTLDTRPTEIVILLRETAKGLPDLVKSVVAFGVLDGAQRARLDRLAKTEKELSSLVKLHDDWQDIESDLRRLEKNLDTEDPDLWWGLLKVKTEKMYAGVPATLPHPQAEVWVKALKEHSDSLQVAIESRNAKAIKEQFRAYRDDLRQRFTFTDLNLKEKLKELPRSLVL